MDWFFANPQVYNEVFNPQKEQITDKILQEYNRRMAHPQLEKEREESFKHMYEKVTGESLVPEEEMTPEQLATKAEQAQGIFEPREEEVD